jgi:hypothetical protein
MTESRHRGGLHQLLDVYYLQETDFHPWGNPNKICQQNNEEEEGKMTRPRVRSFGLVSQTCREQHGDGFLESSR